MDSSRRKEVTVRWPVVTMTIITVAIVTWFAPRLCEWLIYDRDAIWHGELWRLFTGQFVHFSPSHLGYDIAAIFVAGSVLEIESCRRYVLLCAVGPIFISSALIVFEPNMRFYGGLSGLATCLVVVLAMEWLVKRGVWRTVGFVVLAVGAAKLITELRTTDSMFVSLEADAIRSHFAHIAGAINGLLWSAALRLTVSPRSPATAKSIHVAPG